MPWGIGGGPWWGPQWSDPEFRKNWAKYGWRRWRYPWLPRGWWTFPEHFEKISSDEEKKMLEEEMKTLKEEMKEIEGRLEELKKKK